MSSKVAELFTAYYLSSVALNFFFTVKGKKIERGQKEINWLGKVRDLRGPGVLRCKTADLR